MLKEEEGLQNKSTRKEMNKTHPHPIEERRGKRSVQGSKGMELKEREWWWKKMWRRVGTKKRGEELWFGLYSSCYLWSFWHWLEQEEGHATSPWENLKESDWFFFLCSLHTKNGSLFLLELGYLGVRRVSLERKSCIIPAKWSRCGMQAAVFPHA